MTVAPETLWGHPGGLDSKGCHTCWTNCEEWGLEECEYHCHKEGRVAPIPSPNCPLSYEANRTAFVTQVIDGDTIELDGGEQVRYIGIDTPEEGEAGFEEATQRNAELVVGQTVTLDVCEEEPEDEFGRTLAYVIVNDIVVNEVLLIEGLAVPQYIPPCGNETACCYEQIVDTVLGSTDLSLIKTDTPDPVTVGRGLIYTIAITNNGPDAATGVVVTDTLPTDVTFVSSSPSQGTCNGTSTVSCDLGDLANGASATVTIVITPTAVGAITNTATVTGNETDPDVINNTTTAVTTVEGSCLEQFVAAVQTCLQSASILPCVQEAFSALRECQAAAGTAI